MGCLFNASRMEFRARSGTARLSKWRILLLTDMRGLQKLVKSVPERRYVMR